jgi:hypothetical protein
MDVRLIVLVATLAVQTQLLPKEQAVIPACVVVFADNTELNIASCTFRYEYGAGKEPPKGLYFRQNTIVTDLLLETGSRTERGVTVVDDRSIPASGILSIAYDWQPEQSNHRLKNVTVKLRSGEAITVERLVAPDRLLSSGRYVFEKRCYLEGTARVGGREGKFSKDLGIWWSPGPTAEIVKEVRF